MYPSKDQHPRDIRTPPRTPHKVQWRDEFVFPQADTESPAEPYHMLDERGLDHEVFLELTNALERYRRSAPLIRVRYYDFEEPESPATYDADDDIKLSSEDAQTGSVFPSYASSVVPFTPSEPTRDVPGNWISEDEEEGLPGTKDLRDFSMRKAEHIVRTRIPGDFEEFARQERRRKGHLKSSLSEAVHKGAEKGGNILSALCYHRRNPEARASASTISSRQLPSDGYHTPPDEDFRLMRKSRKQEKADIDRTRVHEYESIFGYDTSRPAVARGAGGVFGPLIASINTLAGIGAPHASLMQSNVKWLRNSLSRSSMETEHAVGPSSTRRRHTREYRDIFPPFTPLDGSSTTSLNSSTTPNGSNSLYRGDYNSAYLKPGTR